MDFNSLKKGDLSFVYLSRNNCSVCHALLPKIAELSEKYPLGELHKVDLDRYPSAAGEFMVFSIPALIVYSRGREVYRGARFFHLDEVEKKLDRYYYSIFDM